MLNKAELEEKLIQMTNESELNYIRAEDTDDPELIGLRIYDPPLVGYGDARDELFAELQKPEAVGPQLMLPEQWLPGAAGVISFFLPFTEEVKRSNISTDGIPSKQWLYARIEGQRFVFYLSNYLKALLEEMGCSALVPSMDERFCAVNAPREDLGELWKNASFTSNWSERHAAFLCGLGTFGLSKGLITEKGMAGRFGSVVTTASFEATVRPYTAVYEYCSRCGACAVRCPAQAITPENGKDQMICGKFVSETMTTYAPRYGCGKCQVAVPCESRIPKKN